MGRDDKITSAIIDLVMKDIDQHGGEVDLDAILRGCMSSFLALAHALDAMEQAKEMLAHFADELENPNGRLMRMLEGERHPLTGR